LLDDYHAAGCGFEKARRSARDVDRLHYDFADLKSGDGRPHRGNARHEVHCRKICHSRGGDFARLDLEFGGHASEGKDDDQVDEATAPHQGITIEEAKLKSAKSREKAAGSGKLEGRLIVKEKRSTGSVSPGGAVKSIRCVFLNLRPFHSVLGLLSCWTRLDNRSSSYLIHDRDAGKPNPECIHTGLVGGQVSLGFIGAWFHLTLLT